MIRISALPLQVIFDAIHRHRNAKKMMGYCLKIKPNNTCAIYKVIPNNLAKRNGLFYRIFTAQCRILSYIVKKKGSVYDLPKF